jgi:hypothetical protein
LVNGKNSEDFFHFLHCFSTDQSEAELLYFYSLFFSVKKPFKKPKGIVRIIGHFVCHGKPFKRKNQQTVVAGGGGKYRVRHKFSSIRYPILLFLAPYNN